MTVDSLVVLLQGRPIGAVRRNRDARVRFTYSEDWRAAADATPLSTSMPLAAASHGHEVVDAFLWGLLPDNAEVLAKWGRRFQVSHRSAFSLLSTPVGEDCAGAVQLVAEDRVEDVIEGHPQARHPRVGRARPERAPVPGGSPAGRDPRR